MSRQRRVSSNILDFQDNAEFPAHAVFELENRVFQETFDLVVLN